MKSKAFIPAIITLLMSGCTAASPVPEIPERGVTPEFKCDASDIQNMVGQTASAETGSQALQGSGAKSLRWIGPDTAVTKDYRQDRLNVAYDRQMTINRINCG